MFETQRLFVRPFKPNDLGALATMRDDEEVARYLGTRAMQTREKVAERLRFYISCYEKFGYGVSAIIHKVDDKMIGWGGLQPLEESGEIEVGYGFDKPYWGRGFATEVALAWLQYGFAQAGLQRIVAVAVPENTGSRHVLEKIGMKVEKHAQHYGLDCVFYAISRDEFKHADSFYVLRDGEAMKGENE